MACVWAPLVSGVDEERAESCGRPERIGAAVRRRTSPAESPGVPERWITSEEVNTRLIPLCGQHLRTGNKCFYFRPVLSSRCACICGGTAAHLGSARGTSAGSGPAEAELSGARSGGDGSYRRRLSQPAPAHRADRGGILPGPCSVPDI